MFCYAKYIAYIVVRYLKTIANYKHENKKKKAIIK